MISGLPDMLPLLPCLCVCVAGRRVAAEVQAVVALASAAPPDPQSLPLSGGGGIGVWTPGFKHLLREWHARGCTARHVCMPGALSSTCSAGPSPLRMW